MKAVFGLVIVACAVVFVSGQGATSSSGSGNENSMASLMRNYGLSRGLGRSSGGLGSMGGMSSLLGGSGGMGNAALLFGGGSKWLRVIFILLFAEHLTSLTAAL